MAPLPAAADFSVFHVLSSLRSMSSDVIRALKSSLYLLVILMIHMCHQVIDLCPVSVLFFPWISAACALDIPNNVPFSLKYNIKHYIYALARHFCAIHFLVCFLHFGTSYVCQRWQSKKKQHLKCVQAHLSRVTCQLHPIWAGLQGLLIHAVVQLVQDNSRLGWSMGWNEGGWKDGLDWKRFTQRPLKPATFEVLKGCKWGRESIKIRMLMLITSVLCLYARYCCWKINVFACNLLAKEAPNKAKCLHCRFMGTFLHSPHTLLAKTGKMSQGVYYMLQFTDTQSNLSAPRTHWILLFLPELSFHFMDHKYFWCACIRVYLQTDSWAILHILMPF